MRDVLLALAGIGFIATGAIAAPPDALEQGLLQQLSSTEQFSATRSAVGGVVMPGQDGAWTVVLDGSDARFINDNDNSAVRYINLTNMYFPDRGGTKWPVDGAQPSLTVRVDDTQNGGAGLIVGYPGGGDYVLFAIGARDQYQILQKKDGRLSRLSTGENDAILPHADNRLLVSQDEGNLAFSVNGTTVYSVSLPNLSNAPIGFGLVGRGNYVLDDLSVQPPPNILDTLREPSCDLPPAQAEDRVVIAGAHEGAASSTVTVAGQDEPTGVVDLDVPAGIGPTYVVATADTPTIWRLRGAVDRVSHFAAISPGGNAAGIVGLPPAKVSFHETANCFAFAITQAGGWRASVPVALQLQHPVDALGLAREPAAIELRSGTSTRGDPKSAQGLAPDFDKTVLRDALRFHPDGLAKIDAKAVVTRDGDAADYDVLPQEWGILQLLKDGAIEADPRSAMTFRIEKPMRFPAGLNRILPVAFELPQGVPAPQGSPGHAVVLPVPARIYWAPVPWAEP